MTESPATPTVTSNSSSAESFSSGQEPCTSTDASTTDSPYQDIQPVPLATPPKAQAFRPERLTSTPNLASSCQPTDLNAPGQPICEGSFVGRAQHRDGSPLAIIFQVVWETVISPSYHSCGLWGAGREREGGGGGSCHRGFATILSKL